MANTYDWKITQMEAKIKDGELENVIFRIWWELVASDGEVKPTYALTMDQLLVEYKEGDPFIPYSDLTKEDVVGWIEASLDVDAIKSKLDQEIYNKKNPVNEYLKPNWN